MKWCYLVLDLKATLLVDQMEDSAKLRLQWHDHGNELSRWAWGWLTSKVVKFECGFNTKMDLIYSFFFRLSREIFGNDDLTDVTLTCRGGNPFHAHKIILAAASTYFKSFFKEVQGKM